MARERELRRIYFRPDPGRENKDYVEIFDGKIIRIGPNDFVVMERTEAVKFMGTYRGFNKEISSGDKPLTWKAASANDKPTEFKIYKEDQYETTITPPRRRREAESADPIAELEHLQEA